MMSKHHIYIFTYLRSYTLINCGHMESHFEFEFEFEFELRLRLRTHGGRPFFFFFFFFLKWFIIVFT